MNGKGTSVKWNPLKRAVGENNPNEWLIGKNNDVERDFCFVKYSDGKSKQRVDRVQSKERSKSRMI
jgi:hypothetical protein